MSRRFLQYPRLLLLILLLTTTGTCNGQSKGPSQSQDLAFATAKFDLGIGQNGTISTVEGNTTSLIESLITIAAVPEVGISGLNRGFVTTCGTKFCLNERPFFCAGTNAYYAALKYIMSDNEVAVMMKEHAAQGATVMRVFAHNDFQSANLYPMQISPGVYSEEALKRLDLTLVAAANEGIRLILVLTNYWPFVGGMQRWVDVILGSGKDLELFYTDATIDSYFKKWVEHLVTRTNTITGQRYIDDPTIFAWEIANEPRTSGQYEIKRGLPPGKLVCNWIDRMSTYVKSLDPNHMVTSGEEGFKADPTATEPHSWINNGYEGADFTCSINLPSIDFGTLHVYGDQWGMPPPGYLWLGENYIKDRAKTAAQANKPIAIEEYGMGTSNPKYLPSRDTLLTYLQDQANEAVFGCSLVWSVSHYSTDSSSKGTLFGSNDGQGYVFGYDGDGSKSVLKQYAYMKQRTSRHSSSRSPSLEFNCIDTPPPGNPYTCEQQAIWDKCGEIWMQGYCLKTCGGKCL